jgi:hypothetical protein
MWRRLRREIGRYRRSVPKLAALGWQDWKDLARAQFALVRAQRDMRSLPTGTMVRDDVPGTASAASDRLDDARRIALAVNRAAEFGLFRPKCLVRSRALRGLLDEDRIEGAEVRVGVQLHEGRFFAHAWVEYAGQVVGDDPARVARFVPMTGIQVADLE